MSRFSLLAAGVSLAMISSLAVRAADSLPTESHKVLPAALALEAAQAAVADCKAGGFQVSAAVVDRNGIPIVILRAEGALPAGMEVSQRKAYTAALEEVSGAVYAETVKRNHFDPSTFNSEFGIGQGSLPIKVGNDTIGGIAVDGAAGTDKDEACAHAGLTKIQDRLK